MKAELKYLCNKTTEAMQDLLGTTDCNLCTAMYDQHYKEYQIDLDFGMLSPFYSQVLFFTNGTKDDFVDKIDKLAEDITADDFADPCSMLTDEEVHEQVVEMLEEIAMRLFYDE